MALAALESASVTDIRSVIESLANVDYFILFYYYFFTLGRYIPEGV